MPNLRTRLASPELRKALTDVLTHAWAGNVHPVDGVLGVLERELLSTAPRRNFTPAHLGLVYLLAEQQGATHVRLRRIWDAKATRPRSPWPWISDSGIRTRCSELVAWGIVEDTGARGESATGRPSTIWSLTGTHPADVGRDVELVPGVDAGTVERLDELLAEAGSDVIIRAQLQLAARVAGIGVTTVDISPDLSGFRRAGA